MNKQDMITAPVAITALTWSQTHRIFEWVAAEAQLVLPILGAIWLIVQILAKIHTTWIKPKKDKEQ
ncbi:MAG: hypothetical protein RIE06_22785 [Roseibium album]|uniref:hypothetical protein n=1 Tax=Roseibium album TaxID=311410 RepID=UPI000D555A9C